jgi:RHS repeat-associated protein
MSHSTTTLASLTTREIPPACSHPRPRPVFHNLQAKQAAATATTTPATSPNWRTRPATRTTPPASSPAHLATPTPTTNSANAQPARQPPGTPQATATTKLASLSPTRRRPERRPHINTMADGLRTTTTTASNTAAFSWDQSASLPLLLTDAQNSYIYGPGGLPVEQISTTGTPSFLHHDQLGSTRLLTDQTGRTSGAYSYTPYGNIGASSGSATSPLQYAGEYTDPQTGLMYLSARYYDPQTGQFTTRDPLEEGVRLSV